MSEPNMVKVFKLEVMVIDHDRLGLDGVIHVLENAHYPNRCISPEIMGSSMREIDWADGENPLNYTATRDQAYEELFE
jgi:hypothetical protein